MNDTNKQQPENEEAHAETSMPVEKASHDLRAAAAEALRMSKVATDESVTTETSSENTTNDLQQEAFKAMKIEAERRREEEERAKVADAAKSSFSKGTRLKLEVTESGETMLRDVQGDLVVGRADNVTDYIPEIDLTPYGAYRLGLSRRHAIILLEGERLIVKDLNSRNGTFVNGVIVPSGGTHTLRDGDDLRFGNLGLKVSFERD
jgi:predicted component of type VI protein secretion system